MFNFISMSSSSTFSNEMLEKENKLIVSQSIINNKLKKIVKEIIDIYKKEDNKKEIVLICLLKGGVYFCIDLSRELEKYNIKHTIEFLRISSYNNDQTNAKNEIIQYVGNKEDLKKKLNNKLIFFVDELLDTGKTILNAFNWMYSETQIKINYIVVMFFKLKDNLFFTLNKKDDINLKNNNELIMGIYVPDLWLIGYGLDDSDTLRGLIDVYAIEKTTKELKNEDDLIFTNKKKYNLMLEIIENQ